MDRLSYYAKKGIPFLFIIDYKKENIIVKRVDELKDIYFKTPILKNYKETASTIYPKILKKYPISFSEYKNAFNKVINEIKKGNTYILNLTFPTKIKTNASLKEIFYGTNSKFKLYFQDEFVCFSPERFIKIKNNSIKTYPMKGTIDATIPNAKEILLNSTKEMAEHTMIVDLLRNDLSMVSKMVRVNRFRYIDKIKAGEKELLQVSSEIEGELPKNWKENLGDIFDKLLPAGSITGAPKIKTCEIINSIENYDRGFYTGIFGVFDGKNLDSAVMIRFIQKNSVYKSGGGITIDSDPYKEYQELLDKVYIPS